jgi:ParB family chromosome partitioning protein
MQPRRYFEPEALRELSDSIRLYGILQPLNVRKQGKFYELISGERRLRAAKIAGMDTVPCLLCDVDMKESSMIALVENLQRRDLDYIDEAEGISRLIRNYSLTQEEVAKSLGKSQSAIANKLRILKLSPEVIYILRESALSERHARALLKLETNAERIEVLGRVIDKNLTVAQTEELIEARINPQFDENDPIMDFIVSDDTECSGAYSFVEALLNEPLSSDSAKRGSKRRIVVKDLRIFINTVVHGLDILKRSGIEAEYAQEDGENSTLLTIRIPKAVA